MKYTNLLDAVTGQISEGKSYKRNKDEDVDAKKKEDKQKRDSKKEPVAEDMRPSEVKPVAGSPLVAGGRVSGHTLQPGFMFRVITGPLSKKDQFCARVKEIDGIKWVYLIDQHGDQDWYKADDVFPTKVSLRKADASNRARFTSMTESLAEAEEPTYAEQDLINDLRSALSKLWKISGDKKFVPDAVKANAKKAFTTSHASRATLAHALSDLWKNSDKDLAPHELKSEIFRALSKSGIREETLVVDESAFEEDEDHAGSLEEAYGRGWAILPATVALYGKKVVDITTAASEWKSDKHPTSILVCHKNENGRDRMLFLSTSGDARNSYKVGQSNETYHDQTGASKGVYTVLNIVVFQDGEIVYQANDKGLTGKASVAVFK